MWVVTFAGAAGVRECELMETRRQQPAKVKWSRCSAAFRLTLQRAALRPQRADTTHKGTHIHFFERGGRHRPQTRPHTHRGRLGRTIHFFSRASWINGIFCGYLHTLPRRRDSFWVLRTTHDLGFYSTPRALSDPRLAPWPDLPNVQHGHSLLSVPRVSPAAVELFRNAGAGIC